MTDRESRTVGRLRQDLAAAEAWNCGEIREARLPRHEPRTPRDVFRHYLRDLVYGANEGIITTFAVAAGVAGAPLGARVE